MKFLIDWNSIINRDDENFNENALKILCRVYTSVNIFLSKILKEINGSKFAMWLFTASCKMPRTWMRERDKKRDVDIPGENEAFLPTLKTRGRRLRDRTGRTWARAAGVFCWSWDSRVLLGTRGVSRLASSMRSSRRPRPTPASSSSSSTSSSASSIFLISVQQYRRYSLTWASS